MTRYSHISDQRLKDLIAEKKAHIKKDLVISSTETNEEDLKVLIEELHKRADHE